MNFLPDNYYFKLFKQYDGSCFDYCKFHEKEIFEKHCSALEIIISYYKKYFYLYDENYSTTRTKKEIYYFISDLFTGNINNNNNRNINSNERISIKKEEKKK